MNITPNKLTAIAAENLDSMLALASTAFTGVERMVALNLNAGRNLLDLGGDSDALVAAKNPDELAAALTSIARPLVDSTVSYSRDSYAISSETVGALGGIVDARLAAVKLDLQSVIDEALKSAPAGSEPAVAALRSAVAATNSAYDVLAKAAKQAGELAESNIAIATDSAAKALGNVTALPTKSKKKAA